MTLKSRWIGLVTILVLFAMAPSSFAQVQIQITPDVSSQEVQTNRNAQTARPGTNGAGLLVAGQVFAPSALTATTLRIAYPGPITAVPAGDGNTTPGLSGLGNGGSNCTDPSLTPSTFACAGGVGIPTGDAVRIEGASGLFQSAGNLRLNTVSSRIEVTLPNSLPGGGTGALSGGNPAINTSSGVFRIVGIRIDANGKSGAQTFSASLSNPANNYLLNTTSGTVINNLGPGIASSGIGFAPGNQTQSCSTGTISSPGTATIFTNRNTPRACGSLILTEGFASAWRTVTQSGNSATGPVNAINAPGGSQIRLTFNNIPAGVTLTLTPRAGTVSSQTSLAIFASPTTVTATSATSVLSFTSTSSTDVEVAEIDYAVTTPLSTTAAVTTPGTISVTATMFPLGDGVDTVGVPRQDQGYPVFLAADVGPTTIVNIIAANTTLLMPYGVVVGGFDTGIAIANTTSDPFGTGGGGATKANGTLVADFFPTTATGGAGTPFTLTTSSTVKPGSGLSSDGTLASGATWTVFLSELLKAAGQTGNFSGYLFIRANFLNAHGTATITDFKTFSLTSNVLVLPPPATTSRDAPTGGAEQLDF